MNSLKSMLLEGLTIIFGLLVFVLWLLILVGTPLVVYYAAVMLLQKSVIASILVVVAGVLAYAVFIGYTAELMRR